MKLTATLTTHDRPEYLSRVLDSIDKNNLTSVEIHVGAEPGCPKNISLLEQHGIRKIHVNKTKLGVRENPFSVLSQVFDEGADYNIYLEEDVVLAPDAFALARWYTQLASFDGFLCGLLLNYSSDPTRPSDIDSGNQFNALGFVLSKFQWNNYFKPAWHTDPRGWDWSITSGPIAAGHISLVPALARSNHSGAIGTYCRPDFQEKTFDHLPISDGAVRNYTLSGRSTDAKACSGEKI